MVVIGGKGGGGGGEEGRGGEGGGGGGEGEGRGGRRNSCISHLNGSSCACSSECGFGIVYSSFWEKATFVFAKYKAGFTQDGDVKVVDVEILADSGYTDHGAIYTHQCIQSMEMGTVPGALIIESIMENVAKALNKRPVVVKEVSLYQKGQLRMFDCHQKDIMGHTLNNCTIREVWRRLKDIPEVEGRLCQVEAFNLVAQGVAYVLGVPWEIIKVKPMQDISSPNSIISGASIAINYHTYCALVIETEVDILTGESQIRRVDIMADYGDR
ncbi:abscisic-aldehyde oxidase [Plakobranchus ocellatus]|uniref:Abscisic-aldehyde oxidase n=1 Tax=Plakobranchus ocellatus TaxID=259542 RepID=A0AAV4D4N7_9GAST|nr:abscisic-aldehyde oxidase [Plakobranchus ocellatus]